MLLESKHKEEIIGLKQELKIASDKLLANNKNKMLPLISLDFPVTGLKATDLTITSKSHQMGSDFEKWLKSNTSSLLNGRGSK